MYVFLHLVQAIDEDLLQRVTLSFLLYRLRPQLSVDFLLLLQLMVKKIVINLQLHQLLPQLTVLLFELSNLMMTRHGALHLIEFTLGAMGNRVGDRRVVQSLQFLNTRLPIRRVVGWRVGACLRFDLI